MKKSFTFDNFYVYDGNRVAYLAAQKIVQFPGEIFNPFYVYSGTGLGKTHLLWALYTELNKKQPSKFFTGNEFERYLDETGEHDTLILVDDINTIGDRYQGRFLEVIDNFLTAGRQICFSGTIAPRELNNFNPKLVSRLEGGLVCDIQPPKEMALVDIIKKKSTEMSIILPDEIALELAQLSAGSFRSIEGMVNRLVAYASLGNLSIDPSSIRMILKDFYPKGLYSPVSSLLEELKKNASEVLQEVTEKIDMREEYRERIYIWEMKGFDTSSLKPLLDGDISVLSAAYGEFIKKVERLIELQKVFGAINTSAHPDEAMRIETMLFSPGRTAEIEILIDKIRPREETPVPVADVSPTPVLAAETAVGQPPEPAPAPAPDQPLTAAYVEPRRSFDTYVIGKGNAAVRDFYFENVVTSLGSGFNPFIIVGGRGKGKTHILEAMTIDLAGRGFTVLMIDLEQPPPVTDAGLGNADILAVDNITALWKVEPDIRHAWFELFDKRIKDNRELIMSSEVNINDDRFADDEKVLFELGVEVVLNPPGPDIAEAFIRKKLPGTWAEQVISAGVPAFETFTALSEFVNSLSPVQPASPPVEAAAAEPAAAAQPASAIEPAAPGNGDGLVSLGLPGEEAVAQTVEAPAGVGPDMKEMSEVVHDMVTEVEAPMRAVPAKPEEPAALETGPVSLNVQLKTVREERLIVPEITGELIDENF